jgi:alpha-1,2-mannosyltransferase
VLDRAGHQRGAGIALGVVVACKPVLLPVLLWPLLRGRRREVVAVLVTTLAATLVGAALVGPAQTLRYVRVALGGYPAHDLDNASLLTTGIRLVTPGREVPPLVDAPGLGWLAGVLVVALLAVTVARAGRHELGLWALVAASLLASPLAWRGYLVVLYPGVIVLLATARTRLLGVFVIALLLVPHTLPSLWSDPLSTGYVTATLLGPLVLLATWAAFTGAASPPGAGSGEEPTTAGHRARAGDRAPVVPGSGAHPDS